MDYEKKYKEALEKARICHKDMSNLDGVTANIAKDFFEEVFPELCESEDERIREALICGMYALKEQHKTCFASIPIDNAIAWLEKQGEQKHVNDTDEDIVKAIKDTSILDMVEPKFKVGEWITDGYVGGQITSIEDNYPCYKIADFMGGINTSIPFTLQDNYHLWSIEDAKDGDVLHSPTHNLIWIHKDIQHYHACVNINYVKENFSTDGFIVTPTDVCPATKDKQTILFAKMKEAGYEWDFEKKEPKKIEQKPTDNDMKELLHTEYEKGKADAIAEIQNHAWSEEDESYLNTTIAYLKDAKEFKKSAENCINWLKSLKDRVQPILRRRHTIFDEII